MIVGLGMNCEARVREPQCHLGVVGPEHRQQLAVVMMQICVLQAGAPPAHANTTAS